MRNIKLFHLAELAPIQRRLIIASSWQPPLKKAPQRQQRQLHLELTNLTSHQTHEKFRLAVTWTISTQKLPSIDLAQAK